MLQEMYNRIAEREKELERQALNILELINDDCFVENKITDCNTVEVENWLYENKIVFKYENHNFSINPEEYERGVAGFRFHSIEDAAAFKLRWL